MNQFYPPTAFIVVFLSHLSYTVWKAETIAKQWVRVDNVSTLSRYFTHYDFFMGLSYSLAAAFTVYALQKFLINRKGSASGLLGGITLTGILAVGGCFLLGCCGSPMLAVYLGLFGASFLGFTKPLVFVLTAASVGIGFYWLNKKMKNSDDSCGCGVPCQNDEEKPVVTTLESVISELAEGMSKAKCRKCRCMNSVLEEIKINLDNTTSDETSVLRSKVESWLQQMEVIEYDCLGCDHCFPAVAANSFNALFPDASTVQSPACHFEADESIWPPVPGEYFNLCDGADCPVAVTTLASVDLSEALAKLHPKGLSIVGKTETENIGVEKVIKNVITNPAIRYLILAGKDSDGHLSGRTLDALYQNGVDENGRVIKSPGKKPILKNVNADEVQAFRRQVEVVDMIGIDDANEISARVQEIYQNDDSCCMPQESGIAAKNIITSTIPLIKATESGEPRLDKKGYFVIIPQAEQRKIMVEHYANDNTLLNVIEGEDAKSIYKTIIDKGLISDLSHSAYLGRELAKAELSIEMGFKYIQDGA